MTEISEYLDKQQTNQDFIVCHFNRKYIVTVIKCLQHCYCLQLLHHILLLSDLLMIDKKKKQVTKTTFFLTQLTLILNRVLRTQFILVNAISMFR